MKKNYLRFGLVYCVIALLIFLAAISVYTKKKTDEANANLHNLLTLPNAMMAMSDPNDLDSLICGTIDSWELMSYLDEDVGFYSSVVDTGNNDRAIVESRDYLEVRYYGEIETEVIENSSERYEARDTQLVPGARRYMFLEEKAQLSDDEVQCLRYPSAYDVMITGARCDDVFVYGGTLTFNSDNEVRTVNIAEPEVVNEDISIPYEEWIVRLDRIDYYSLDVNSGKNKKARKLNDEYVELFLNGKASDGITFKDGFFTTTASAIYVFDKGNYLVTYFYVMNPFQIVLRDNKMIYILSVLALLIVEAVIVFAVRKLYINQKRFELRSEKLTKGIAYDLQGPLAVTREHLEKWENIDEDKRPEYSEKIISEVDHMSSLVTRLLELSKIHDGNVKLNCEDVDILLLTQNIIKRNRKSISDKKIDLTFGYDKGEAAYPVYADLEMMYIVINNFMTNAVKYCDHTITIRLEKYRNTIEFNITNDGAVIEKTELGKVWDVLYNSNKGKSESDVNSGVGLSVVKNILDAHNAKYGCYSGSKGTSFWFSMNAYDDRSFS